MLNRLFALGFGGLIILLAGVPLSARTESSTNLNRFFTQVQNYSARFTQVVMDEALNPIQESSGTLWLQRPNKFRWDYNNPYKQQIVGDGKKIWVYDEELQQVSVRPLQGSLGGTPAVLLAGHGKLSDSFLVKSLGVQGKIDWVQLIPKRKDGGYEDIRIGFERGSLRMLEMVDGFGNTTRVTLIDGKENKKIDLSMFRFKPPQGVDVVGN